MSGKKKILRQFFLTGIASSLLAPFIILSATLISGNSGYNKWDNFEYLTPVIYKAHSQYLKSAMPFWNPHQHLGEPLLATGQSGALYLPYTLSVFFISFLGISSNYLPLVIVLSHSAWAAGGWFLLFRMCRIRPLFSAAVSVSICCGPFLNLISSVWIFIYPVLSWAPWIFYSLIKSLATKEFSWKILLLPVSLAAIAMTGHPQHLFYIWMMMIVFAAAFTAFRGIRTVCLKKTLILLAVALFFSAPVLIPLSLTYISSIRHELPLKASFLAQSVRPDNLISFLSPALKISNNYMKHNGALLFYQGSWLLPVIAAAGVSIFIRKKKNTGYPGFTITETVFISSLLTGLFFLLLSLGTYGGIYTLTYGLPIWSSFKWPFKMAVYANCCLALSGCISLEYIVRNIKSVFPSKLIKYAAGTAAAVLAFFIPEATGTVTGVLSLILGMTSLFILIKIGKNKNNFILACLIIVSSFINLSFMHKAGIKTYKEKYGDFKHLTDGLDTRYRAIPTTSYLDIDYDNPLMQPLGIFHSATINGYYSATGEQIPFIPYRQFKFIPADASGVVSADVLKDYIRSNFLKIINVKYIFVRDKDKATIDILKNSHFRLITASGDTLIYEQEDVLERAYFASNIFPYADKTFFEGFFRNKVPVKSAYIDGLTQPAILPQASIKGTLWKDNCFFFEVTAPEGGLLVVSSSFNPEWEAIADGKLQDVIRVNGFMTGTWLKAGVKSVKFRYKPDSLIIGLLLAVAAAGWLGISIRMKSSWLYC